MDGVTALAPSGLPADLDRFRRPDAPAPPSAPPVQVAAQNVFIDRARPARRGPLRVIPAASSGAGIAVAIVLAALILVGGFVGYLEWRKAPAGAPASSGYRIVTVADPEMRISLFARPPLQGPVVLVFQAQQGIPCEVIESVLVGGDSRWYHVKVHGGEGWTQQVTRD
jgi:hypothetical protein